ncbi:MAG TPA: methylamine utilization protein [Burkholderiales bacterium]|nr:methylamine utilization protein [Burkholderiales bacterium]
MSRSPRPSRIRWMNAVALASLALCCLARAQGVALTVSVKQRDDRPLIGAVVSLEPQSMALPRAQPVKAVMDQVNLAFVPDVLVIPLHSSVQFPNSDAISHQVYSFSDARRFQLPLYRGKPYPPVVFDRPGVVTLGCNIHDNMLAYIFVTDAPFFGRTGSDGAWTAPSLPAGTYQLRVWHPALNEPKELQRIVEAQSGRSSIELRLTRALRPAPLTQRPHSWEY